MTKPRPPRPVRAWAIVQDDGTYSETPYLFIKTTKPNNSCLSKTERMVRVTVVPEGATSAEAECARLRRLLRKASHELRPSAFPDDRALAKEIDAALRRKGGRR